MLRKAKPGGTDARSFKAASKFSETPELRFTPPWSLGACEGFKPLSGDGSEGEDGKHVSSLGAI